MHHPGDPGGGFSFGNVGGNVQMSAGSDIVGRDKTSTTGGVEKGFAGDEQKQQFQAQVDELRETLRAMKASIEAHPALSADDKEAMTAEIIKQVSDLKAVKDQTASLPPKTTPSPEVATTVEQTLDRASGVIDKLKAMSDKAQPVADAIANFAVKYGPLVLSAR